MKYYTLSFSPCQHLRDILFIFVTFVKKVCNISKAKKRKKGRAMPLTTQRYPLFISEQGNNSQQFIQPFGVKNRARAHFVAFSIAIFKESAFFATA
jgi:hypothetical protein